MEIEPEMPFKIIMYDEIIYLFTKSTSEGVLNYFEKDTGT